MRKKVIALRGIPGSGKSTYARTLIGETPDGSIVRINNDELVGMLFGTMWQRQPGIADILKVTRESLLKAYLQQPEINTIIIDNTNLQLRTLRDLQKITLRFGATFIVDDTLLHVDEQTCVERDALRPNTVGKCVIRAMARDAAKLGPWKSPDYEIPNIKKYSGDQTLPPCYIFDIDGTLALNKSGRNVHDETRVFEDTVNTYVHAVYKQLKFSTDIVIMSGRHDDCRPDTLKWLQWYIDPEITTDDLYMRAADDNRPDYIIKYELFQQVTKKYFIVGAFDDRDQVVDLWRNKLQIPTFQVANGDF